MVCSSRLQPELELGLVSNGRLGPCTVLRIIPKVPPYVEVLYQPCFCMLLVSFRNGMDVSMCQLTVSPSPLGNRSQCEC